MNDWKSKLPDLNELASMSSKLFKGVKSSVSEIIDDYKKKRQDVVETEVKKESTANSNAAPIETLSTVESVTVTESTEKVKKPRAKKVLVSENIETVVEKDDAVK